MKKLLAMNEIVNHLTMKDDKTLLWAYEKDLTCGKKKNTESFASRTVPTRHEVT